MKIVHVLAAETMRQKTILFSWRQKVIRGGGEGHYYTYLAFVGEREPLVKKKRPIYIATNQWHTKSAMMRRVLTGFRH